jgi:hypothetical protein
MLIWFLLNNYQGYSYYDMSAESQNCEASKDSQY